jgi:hypothetical protein
MNSDQGPDSSGESAAGADGKEKRLVVRLREAIRARHYSRRTEQAYWYWIRWFILFHGKRHPARMGAGEERVPELACHGAQRGGSDAEPGAFGAAVPL